MAYWILAVLVTVFGFISGFSIGLPILVVGVTMLALGPFRARPRIFWPVFLGVVAAVVTFMAIAPFMCTGSAGLGEGSTPTNTVCTSLIGIRWEAPGLENPSTQPVLIAGTVVGLVVALVTYFALSRRAGVQRQPST
jgi:hypothetical protein